MITSVLPSCDERIADKLLLLKRLDERIGELEQQLNMLRRQRNRIDEGIQAFRAANAPITMLPAETLLQIFTLLADRSLDDCGSEPKDAMAELRHLQLVCKAWHDLIANRPSFWTSIHISADVSDTMVARIPQQQRYVEMCMVRSKEAPLDVSIELDTAPGVITFMKDRIVNAFPNPERPLSIASWCEDNRKSLLESPMAERYIQLLTDLVGTVTGVNGCHLSRWRSLYLYLPFDPLLINRLWSLFDAELPTLQRLTLRGLNRDIIHYIPGSPSFAFLPQLKALSLYGCFDLDNIPECPSVEELTLCAIDKWMSLTRLNSFHRLRRLEIVQIYGRVDSVTSLPGPIVLPHLQHLYLEGFFPSEFYASFQLSSLMSLSFVQPDVQGPLPDAELFGIAESIVLFGFAKLDPRKRSVFLSSLLPQITAVETIAVSRCIFVTVFDEVMALSGEESLPKLRSITLLDDETGSTIMENYVTFADGIARMKREEISESVPFPQN